MDETELRAHFREAATLPTGWSGDLYFENAQGHKLRYAHAPALTDKPRGTIIHRHGHGESIDLYNELMRWYQTLGFDVWTYDLCGYGLSGGKDPNNNPHPRDTMHAVNDLDLFVHRIVNRVQGKPLIMSNHSLSGHSGLIYLQRSPDTFSGAVMSSPMFDIYRMGMPALCRPVVRAIFRAACMVGLKDVETPVTGYNHFIDRLQNVSHKLTTFSLGEINYRQHARQMLKEKNPDRFRDRPTFGWVDSAYRTIMPTLKRSFLHTIGTPVLIGSAGPLEDLVATDAHERVARLAPGARLVRLPLAVHSLWHDREHSFRQWQNHVESFLDELAPRAAAYPDFSLESGHKHAPEGA